MRIRILRLLNNFYKSNMERGSMKTDALGSYCVFGHFDALEVEEVVDLQEKRVWESIVRSQLKSGVVAEGETPQEGYIEQNVVCIMRQGEDDKTFWEKTEMWPFLFVSFIDFDYGQGMGFEKINKKLGNTDIFFYLSYGHNKVTAVTCAQTYGEGMRVVRELREKFSAKKMHTLFAVREDKLECSGSVEMVNCRWQGILRPGVNEEKFIQELANKLRLTKGISLVWYDKLGNNDVLIEANNIELKNLLPLYKMGNLMTHTNGCYEETWINLETDIFLPGGKRIDARGTAEANQDTNRGTEEGTAGIV